LTYSKKISKYPILCSFQGVNKLSGSNGGGATPVPIPNTAVKPSSADGTAPVTVWESRSLPEAFFVVQNLVWRIILTASGQLGPKLIAFLKKAAHIVFKEYSDSNAMRKGG
jgi:hypothetical protein